jgi:hypothetical protein
MREDLGVERPPLCCPGCECGRHLPGPQGCENCTELGFCMAAAEGRQAECPRELALREHEIAAGDWLIPDEIEE